MTMCTYHPVVPSVFVCSKCQKPLCQNCRRLKFGNSFCQMCFESQSFQQTVRPVDAVRFEAQRKPKVTEAVFSPPMISKAIYAVVALVVLLNYKAIQSWAMDTVTPLWSKASTTLASTASSSKQLNPRERGIQKVVELQFTLFAKGLDVHRTMNGDYPANFKQFVDANYASEAKGRDMTVDPWGTSFEYSKINRGYELRSAGPDKSWGTSDDIVRQKQDPL